jgi:hypothetical protein
MKYYGQFNPQVDQVLQERYFQNKFNGISIARYTKHLANNHQVLRDFPQEIAEAEARCEEINAELMI